uniref:Myb-like domain-containing protein n=1 Tax=Globisporangium ultimum (strain ATCC 200006 / CBS 805.95 / DAOM BR144) TaxID=431595 RepID=K3X5K6_GLOUD
MSSSNDNRPLPALSPATSPAFRVATAPWTEDEHRRFLAGLETYGSGQTANPQAAWQSITAAVRTRPIHDVKAHARRYFLELQMANTRKRKEDVAATQSQDSRWTLEEDARFEELLAYHSSASVCYPWDAIAAKLPGKTHRDARERYQKLCYDVARIEAGHHVSMSLSRSVSGNRGYDDMSRSNQDAHCDDNDYTPTYECAVTLTSIEEKLLMRALGQVHVSSKTSPEVLTAIASTMAAFANSKDNKIPPQRTMPLFTLEDAQTALENVIQRQQTDVRVILETLIDSLKLQPPSPSN